MTKRCVSESVLLLLTCVFAGAAEPRASRANGLLHGIFSDHMVLQRDRPVAIWGRTQPSISLTVRFAGQARNVNADSHGNWRVALDPMPASLEGRTLTVTNAQNDFRVLTNVVVGDVWLCSGQSNMEFPVSRTNNGKHEAAQADYPDIRLVKIPKRSSLSPGEDIVPNVRWADCTPRSAANFSAVAYFFGRELRRELSVPVGLIQCAVGSTILEAWTPASAPEQTALTRPVANRNRPGSLFNGMITPLNGYSLKGVLWYQGEANAKTKYGAAGGLAYKALLEGMIREWRTSLRSDDLPFEIVQLSNFGRVSQVPSESRTSEIREAQALCANSVSNCGLIVTIDIGDSRRIHPKDKQEVGRRLALNALANVYGQSVTGSGPSFRGVRFEGNSAYISFHNADAGLTFPGPKLTGFSIAGEDAEFFSAEAQVEGDSVVVWSPHVSFPFAVRYAWGDNPICNLYNLSGLPAGPFRAVR